MINLSRGGHERPQSNHEWPHMETEREKDHGQTAFPNQIPPRKYLSHKVAQALKLPYTCAEAFRKFKKLLAESKTEWELNDQEHEEQLKICKEILELGSYVLPGEVIASEKFKDFVCKCLKMELLMSIKNIRRGESYLKIAIRVI